MFPQAIWGMMVVLGLASAAQVQVKPQETAATKRLVVVSDWARTPDPVKTADLYPKAALAAAVKTGIGLVECRIAANGALGDCSLLSETPIGLGFGAAALQIAPQLRVNLASADGAALAGGYVDVPLRFNAPPPAAAPLTSGGDVVVTAKRLDKCGDKDRACWQDVAEHLWKDYPKQIQTICTNWQTTATRNYMNYNTFAEMGGSSFAASQTSVTNDDLKPAQKYVCDYRPGR